MEQKTGFSIFGLLFSSAYYVGKGKVGKGLALGVLTLIPVIGTFGVPIYCGMKANEEVGANPFKWSRAIWFCFGFALIVNALKNGAKVMVGN